MNTVSANEIMREEITLSPGTRTIGRGPDNDIVINDPSVSTCHAKIVTFFDASYIEDLDSRNGTYVNGKKIKKHVIHAGDNVFFGSRIFDIIGQNKG